MGAEIGHPVRPDIELKSSTTVSRSFQKVAVFTEVLWFFKIAQIFPPDLGYFCNKLCQTKNFQKSPNLVTLRTSKNI